MSLKVYQENGFKLFVCNPDKTAADWKNPRKHLDLPGAELLQSMGDLIGAWIPDDIIVIDLNRNPDGPDGVKIFEKIKAKYNINPNITAETFTVVSAGGGYHIFLRAGNKHKFSDGGKAEGIKLLTDSTYVITAGSPGYSIHPNVIDLHIADISDEISGWLSGTVKSEEPEPADNHIPLTLFIKILKKLKVNNFIEENKWFDFIRSCQAAAGYTKDVKIELLEWSKGFRGWDDDTIRASIDLFKKDGNATINTFVKILREQEISAYFIKQILSYNTSLELYENMRDDGQALPFPEPDYDEISDSKEANELYITAGNSVAATLVGYAIHRHIIYCEADKEFYLFDGNRWLEFQDMFSVVYTVLVRLCKFMFAKKKGSDVASENFLKLIKAINKTHWKYDVMRELQCREGVFQKKALWDSEKLKETLTTIDGVIDFTGREIITRKGVREEYRKTFVPYKTDEIIEAGVPKAFNKFLESLFPDPDTLLTARQGSSMFISGNAKKVFQVYHGEGDNGKSTWIEIEKELFGDKAHTYSTSLILNNKYGDDRLPPEAADFMGKYLLYGSEVQKGKQLSLGKIKNFTGDDTIAATPKYKDQREFRPTWQMVLSVNDLPFFDGADRAFINRLLVLPFEKTFVDSEEIRKELLTKGYDKNLVALKIDANKLKKEIRVEFPAVMNQKIKDYVDLKNNYNGIIQQSAKCKLHKETYIEDNNDIENFITELCTVSLQGDYFITSEDITDAYKNYTGLSKLSSSFVTRGIKKCRQEVFSKTEPIEITLHDPGSHEFRTEKKLRRGLKNIRLKTISELEAEPEFDYEKPDDDIPF